MKLGTEVHKVETFGVDNQTAFSIEAHSISFRILSDQLYSDKVLAVVRELSCNAFDAHVDGGKGGVPFRVHLPNTLEPWFAVRDWGIGLSDDNVRHLYTTYFGSTKRDSNDKVGCLGLGSKSPFAYTESFTVTSWHEGMKRTYTAFIGEEGIPMITQMGEEATDEINGLEVSLPVRPQDASEFAEKAETALRRFNPAPEVVGNEHFSLDSVEYWMEGKGWAVRKSDDSGYYGHRRVNDCAIAVQGSVAYPIDNSALKDLTNEQRKVLDLPIDIHFDLGELGITPSRESLSYSDGTKGTIDTIGNVIKRLDKVFAELPSKFEDKFDSCSTWWEACLLFNDLFSGRGNSSHALSSLANSSKFDLNWNGKKLKSHFKFEGSDVSGTFRMVKFERNRFGGRAQSLSADHIGNWKFRASNESKFFFDDIGRGAHSRIKNWIETGDMDKITKVYLVKTDDPKDLDLFIGFMGDIKLTAVSTLPKPVRQSTANNGSRTPQCKVWKWDGAGNAKENWDTSSVKLKDGGVYVTLRRFKVLKAGGTEMDLSYQYRLYREAGLIDTSTPIYGLQPRNSKAVADNPKWVKLEDHIRAQLTPVLKAPALANKIANAECFRGFDLSGQFNSNDLRFTASDDTWNDLADTSLFKKFVVAYEYMSNESTDGLSVITNVAQELGCTVPTGTPEHDLDLLWKDLLATYPMFEFLSTTSGYYGRNEIDWTNTMLDKLVQYIKGIDEAV